MANAAAGSRAVDSMFWEGFWLVKTKLWMTRNALLSLKLVIPNKNEKKKTQD